MLLFKPYHMKPIKDRLKVETRRLWKKPRCKVGSEHLCKTVMMSPSYFAKVKITDVFQQRLGEMTEQDAYNEGGYTLAQYKELWNEINPGAPWDDDLLVWVVRFDLIYPVCCVGCKKMSGPICSAGKWSEGETKDPETTATTIRNCDRFDFAFTDLFKLGDEMRAALAKEPVPSKVEGKREA